MLFITVSLLLCVSCVYGEIPRACSTPDTDKFPFCDTKLSVDDRVRNLISLIHLEEKPPLLTARMAPAGNIPRIGLPAYDWGANCIHGVQSYCGTRCATSFANPCGLGATFNSTGIKAMGNIIGVELRSLWLQGVGENHPNPPPIGLDCWSPNININRDPRWGRNQEVPSEDPYLTAQFGIAYTRGLQEGQDSRYLQAVVTLKHWAAYSLEDYNGMTRHNFNAKVTPYDLTNTYFPAWKASVMEGKAKGVMCSYNALNGVPTCASQFLNTTLRGDYGFEGYVTSDSGAINDIFSQHHYVQTPEEAAAVAIKAGTDVNSGSVYLNSLITALNKGLLKESDIDNALYNTLRLRFELGLMDPIDDQPYWHVPPEAVNTPQSQATNLLLTQETMVLLKNNKNTLPFPKGKKIAVLGPHGNATGVMLGNYLGQICPTGQGNRCVVPPYIAIEKDNTGGSTTYIQGCSVSGNSTSGFQAAFAAAQAADHVVLVIGIDGSIENEARDRSSITLPGVQLEFAQRVIALGKPTAVVFFNGGSLDITWFKDNADAVIEAFYPGYAGGLALSSVIFGDYNPGGKLPVTFYDSSYLKQVDFADMSMTNPPGRSYRYYTGTPVYEFGYGLSYTTFKLTWNQKQASERTLSTVSKQFITYTVEVTNTGKVKGDEVVLAFFSPNKTGPLIKQLFGFQRITLQPNETQKLTFELNVTSVAVANEKGDLVTSPGDYDIIFTNGVSEKLVSKLHVVGQSHLVEKYAF